MIPSGFGEVGEVELQDELVAVARKHGVRVMGPNIYGFYYTPENLCATFCTAYDVRGKVALSSQSGGVGMSIIGFSRSTKMGVSAIVGLGNKSDLDEDDLLTYFEQDDNTQAIAMHCEDLKDGRAFAEVAQAGLEEEAGDRPQGRPHRLWRQGRRVPYRGAGRRRQDLRRRPALGRRDPRAEPALDAGVRARAAGAADAAGRERGGHHRRRRLRGSAVRRLPRQRPRP